MTRARTKDRVWRAGTALFVLLLVLLATSVPSLAGPPLESGGRSAPSGYITFGIQPSGPHGPDKRSWFVYVLRPGTTVVDWVAIENFSEKALRISLYSRDAMESGSGGLAVQQFDQRPVGVGKWIHLPVSSVVADPDKAVIVPFTVSVPRDASPGDHVGGILASITRQATGSHGARIRVEQRVGERVYVRVGGPLRPKLTISGLASHYTGTWSPFSGGTLTITYTLRNTGNLELTAPTMLRLTNPFGWSESLPQTGAPPDLLPGSSVQITRVVRGVYPAFSVSTDVTVHTGFSTVSTLSGLDVSSVHLVAVSASTSTLAIPWPAFVLALLVIAVGGGIVYRRRSRRPPPPPPERPTPRRREAVPV